MAQSSGVHPSAFLEVPMPSAVVLSGQTTAEDLAAETEETLPDYTLERIDQLVPPRLWEEFGWEDT
jgi:4-nitrophenyl phosphatase